MQRYISKNYTNDIDLYIDTYESIGTVNKEKNYKTSNNEWFETKNNIDSVKKKIEELNPYFYNIDKFDIFQKDIIIPKVNFLLDNLDKKKIKTKNTGLLTSFLSQSLKRNKQISNINNLGSYDYVFLSRPDVSFEYVQKLEMNNYFNFFQNNEYYGQDRAVYNYPSKFIENLCQNDQIPKYFVRKFSKIVPLVGDVAFIAKPELIKKFNDEILFDIEKNILELDLKKYQFLKWTDNRVAEFNDLPSWEMPEFLLSIFLENKIPTNKYGVFRLNNKNGLRQFEFVN